MKKVLLTGVALAALACGPALAADLPVRMPVKAPPAPVAYGYNWSGFYIGAHGGGAWSEKCFTDAGIDDGCHDADGWLAGGQIGFNWQSPNNIVLGIEFSGSAADISGDHTSLLAPPDFYHSEISSLFLLTGRLGFAFDRALLYVTGGGAWVGHTVEYTTGGITDSVDKDRTGWTIGAGLEYGITPNWSIAAQYNFVDLGEKDVTFVNAGFTAEAESTLHLATVRLNYRFGGFGGPPVAARY